MATVEVLLFRDNCCCSKFADLSSVDFVALVDCISTQPEKLTAKTATAIIMQAFHFTLMNIPS